MSQNIFFLALHYLLVDLVGEMLYFPVWWYSEGLKKAWQLCVRNSREANEILGLTIWLKNLFRPMFAQYDWQGRLNRFIVRGEQINLRSFAFLVWAAIIWCWLIFWLILPFVVFTGVIFNLGYRMI